MPRASDRVAGQFTINQWTPVMGADVVDGMKVTVDMKQGNWIAVDLDEELAGLGQFADIGDTGEFRHREMLQRKEWSIASRPERVRRPCGSGCQWPRREPRGPRQW